MLILLLSASERKSAQVVGEFATKFHHDAPVLIADRSVDAMGAAAGANDTGASGLFYKEKVHVFHSGSEDRPVLAGTLFHEFLHHAICFL